MTIKQRQHLLAYLGYYVGNVDGAWGQLSRIACTQFQKEFGLTPDGVCGSQTEKALTHAVAYGMPSRASGGSQNGDFWGSVKYFKKHEFACKCGCGADAMEETLIRVADRTREHFGKPITVTSGRRCATHNAKVGGVSNSRHLHGKAMDFCVVGKTAIQVLDYVKQQPEIRYTYAIDGTYVHMDID